MAHIVTYSLFAQGNQKLSENFVVREFACKDGSDLVKIDLELVKTLQKIRDLLGVPVIISSGYRTNTYNSKIGGSRNSWHLCGSAADIFVSGKTTEEVAKCAESLGVPGVIRYVTDNFVHIDMRNTGKYYAVVNNGIITNVSTYGDLADPVIRTIQTKLKVQYDSRLVVDGYYGINTRSAMVKGLQSEFNSQYGACLKIDGIWGAKTEAECRTITSGTGGIQYIIQAALYCNGYHEITVDGIYGKETVCVVKEFQKDIGHNSDGQFDEICFRSLFF